MAEYIDVPNLILFLKCGEYESLEDIIKFIENNVTTDVIERSKIDKALKEMDDLASHKVRPISFDQSVAIDMCIDIVKKI